MKFIKQNGKKILCGILERQVKQLRKKYPFKIVAVTGSVGKTSTKLAIAKVLGAQTRVRFQEGNYNDRLTVPLVIFGHQNPESMSISAWRRIIKANKQQIKRGFEYDVVVVELGTDAPGQIAEFAYLKPDLSVVTAATPEHMEFFHSIERVAEEELAVMSFSGKTLVNVDDVPGEFLNGKQYAGYGSGERANYRYLIDSVQPNGSQSLVFFSGPQEYRTQTNLLGRQGAKVALAAFAAAAEMQLDLNQAAASVASLQAFSGRMKVYRGIKNSVIIDDTYNSSPAAVKAGLDVVYSLNAPQKIAILGSMNELGLTSEEAHKEVGQYCDPLKLAYVVTVGKEAEMYLAPAAQEKGCMVISFNTPYEAGEFVQRNLQESGLVFAKGSQNQVFTEESLKVLLEDKADIIHLVRQSDYWMKIKQSQFGIQPS